MTASYQIYRHNNVDNNAIYARKQGKHMPLLGIIRPQSIDITNEHSYKQNNANDDNDDYDNDGDEIVDKPKLSMPCPR